MFDLSNLTCLIFPEAVLTIAELTFTRHRFPVAGQQRVGFRFLYSTATDDRLRSQSSLGKDCRDSSLSKQRYSSYLPSWWLCIFGQKSTCVPNNTSPERRSSQPIEDKPRSLDSPNTPKFYFDENAVALFELGQIAVWNVISMEFKIMRTAKNLAIDWNFWLSVNNVSWSNP